MFYKLITHKRDRWLQSSDCTVRPLLRDIERRGMMRDAQLEAIKTYLFLKIACQGKPLHALFAEGRFNATDTQAEDLSMETHRTLLDNPAAVALFQYARLRDRSGRQVAPELERFIRQHVREIDYEQALRDIFYGVSYADYLFSLPMGAGKTYLMAAFIYIDLYFAQLEPDNPLWAHNFLILVPSALKSSIIPSLRNIRHFDPAWIFPDEVATRLRRLVQFEVLDEQKTAKGSTLVRNPNAQKVNLHLNGGQCMGLVAITNAEKVILDRMDKAAEEALAFDREEYLKIVSANELRHVIGRIPHLSIFIDEVHHATDSDIKLRRVVTAWATQGHSCCQVLGFTGTPYLEKAESVTLGGSFVIRHKEISNVVYHYPLLQGIDNFLKHPVVKIADSDRQEIVRQGVDDFLDSYLHTTYPDGTTAKMAVYCGQIETLEEEIYPIVATLVAARGWNPVEVVLKRHRGNPRYPMPEGSEAAFQMLDSPLSPVRIVLLVQIGKEGWDCKSLTAVLLPHEGACPKNMVLQTSCRCLRQVTRGSRETALIWMNRWNADKLNRELKQQQNITLSQFAEKPEEPLHRIRRHSRMEQRQVPPIDFYQLRVEYKTYTAPKPDTAARLADPSLLCRREKLLVTQQEIDGQLIRFDERMLEGEERSTTFRWWLHRIARESMGTLTTRRLLEHEPCLRAIYEQTQGDDYDHARIRSLIRQAFVPRRRFEVQEEVVPQTASILSVHELCPIHATDIGRIYPPAGEVEEILRWDAHPEQGDIPPEKQQMLQQLEKMAGVTPEMVETLRKGILSEVPRDPHPERQQTYHYLPYRFDSRLELEYFTQALRGTLAGRQLEYYFNGDDTLTDFKIRCYRRHNGHWQYDGLYVPDFLVLSRTPEGRIDRICIIETKGEGFAARFQERLQFMQQEFIPLNNRQFGRERFRFLYLEDTLTPQERVQQTLQMINEFFH